MKHDHKMVLFFTFILAGLAGLIIWKFLIPLVSAVILSYIFHPVYRWIRNKTNRPRLSGFLMLFLIIIGILLPLALLTKAIINEATTLFNTDISLEQIQESLHYVGIEIDISAVAADAIIEISQAIKQWIVRIPWLLSRITDAVVNLFVMFFVMFYLFTDGEKIVLWLREHLPLRESLKKEILLQTGKLTSALLIGQVITAIIQGIVGGIGFLIFGIKGAVLWGFVMTILAFIPVIGTFLVWVPAGIILILEQDYFSGIGILIYGALIISTIDNILKPKLVSKRAPIHPVTVLLGVLGGLTVFGIMGVVIGPVILSLFSLFLRVYLKSIRWVQG